MSGMDTRYERLSCVAKAAGIAAVSDVALMRRLQKAEGWLRGLCVSLLQESGWELPVETHGFNVRALDGTLVKEPGRSGSLWRIHYSIRIPSLVCDHFELTATKGAGTGETLGRFAANAGDLVLADRGFCKPNGIEALDRQGAAVMVRLNTSTLPLWNEDGSRFALAEEIAKLQQIGTEGAWQIWVQGAKGRIAGRLCAIRKSEQAALRARRQIERKAQQGGPQPKPETLQYARYVMVFTTVPASRFSTAEVLEWYRVRWQIELVFKRLKTLAELGALPKHADESARAGCMANSWLRYSGKNWKGLGAIFPPGATGSHTHGNGSAWRVFSFTLHAVQQAVEPTISLQSVLHNWRQLEADLREGRRQQTSRVNTL